MCRRVSCRRCGKPTWAGCGRHVEAALAGVPKEERCRCREEAAAKPKEAFAPPRRKWFGLF